MIASSSYASGLTEIQQAVRDQFQRGGSFTTVLVVVLCVLAGVLLIWVLTRLFLARHEQKVPNNPKQLFRALIEKLDISPAQRQTLGNIVKDLRLEQPSTILLSESLFDRGVSQWRSGCGGAADDEELIHRLRTVLFPKTL